MGKRERHFERVTEYKERFRRLSTELIRYRLTNFGTALYKEAAIALRELLEERGAEASAPSEQDAEPGAAADGGARLVSGMHSSPVPRRR